MPKWVRHELLPASCLLLGALLTTLAATGTAAGAQKRVFLAPDDHTDYFWSATDLEYRQLFLTMLDYYIDKADATAAEPPEHQSRFSADGSLWLWEYEKNKTPAQFQRLIDKIKSGHISAPKNPLVITYGGVPAEAVIRSMYYAGQLERRYGIDLPLAIAMENAGMPYGLGALWAGAGARYSWKGVCNCPSLVPDLDDRDHEIYNWLGPDGSSILMKWNSLHRADDNMSIGGYAEARSPAAALDLVTTSAAANGFAARYPYDTIGVFGQGWDDLLTTNLDIQQACKQDTEPGRTCIVSNSTDFFQEFQAAYGSVIPTVSAGFGNEWDLGAASLAEVSARVKRSLERLRSAEALATLVSLVDSSFMDGRAAARDRAFLNMGLYFEHDFENGGPRVSGSARIAWQRQVAAQIEDYVDTLMTDAVDAFGAMIQKTGSNPRVFVFNPLSWTRTDIADISYQGPLPVHVRDVVTGAEVPSQVVALDGAQFIRILASDIPSVGYKAFEIVPGSGQAFANGPTVDPATGTLENEFYRIRVAPRGAIVSFVDKLRGNREFAGTTGGFALNDLGPGSGTLVVENAGPASVTLVATGATPLSHRTRVTIMRGSDRVEIRNEVTQNFGGTQRWRFSVNVTSPDVRHEEVGAIARARLTSNGGNYSPRNARYDYLTLNHFADMSGAGAVGVTLSNADAYFMQVGNSGVTTLDTTTPQLSVLLGGSLRPVNSIPNQGGDSYFLQRFALRSHGSYDQAGAMRFALEHQNPLVVGPVLGGAAYPEGTHSFVSISEPGVLLWALKPAEEGIGAGIIARVWNVNASSTSFSLGIDEPIARAAYVWHTETNRGDASVAAGVLTSAIAQQQMLSFRILAGSLPPTVTIVASDATAMEGEAGSFTVSRSGAVASALDVRYSVGGTAKPGSDYEALSGVATIPAGASSVVIPVIAFTDAAAEPNETVTATLVAQTGYVVGSSSSAVVTLVDAGGAPANPGVLFGLNEGAGGSTADASGAIVGTLQGGPAWTTGKYGKGLSFDGVDDRVSVPDSAALRLGQSGTIAAWIRRNTIDRWHGIVSKGVLNSDPAHNYALEIDNLNRPLCLLGDGASAVRLRAPMSAAAGQFYHLACAWDGSTVRLYVDGALSASTSQTVRPAANTLPLYIGQFGDSADRFSGIIDEVKIYTRALTQVEVQDSMNTPIGSAPAPDVTRPTATIRSPAQGTTVTGVVTITADAADDIGVAGVQFMLDGANLGSEDPTAPYSRSWDTRTVPNGAHILKAIARDAAGNRGSSADVSVTVNNDVTPPSTPSGLAATVVSSVRVDLTWNASTDNIAVTGYRVRRAGAVIATTTEARYSDTGVTPGTTYTYTVAAVDAAGNMSAESEPTTAAPPRLGTGLVAAWPFQSGSGTAATDASGNSNTGTLTNGPVWTAGGRFGNAIAFDGVNDYVTAPDRSSLDIGGTGAIEAWVRFTALNRWQGIIAKGNANANHAHNYALELNPSNRFQCIWGDGINSVSLLSTVSPSIDQFYHVACVWTGQQFQVYVNGTLNAATMQTLTPAPNGAPVYLGQFGGDVDRLQGIIDEVRIYNTPRTQSELQSDMNTAL